MILFRRVGGAFRGIEGREWALLSLETLGVIAGILIAFELNEWAARRSEAARHARLMERLFEESEIDVAALRGTRDLVQKSIRAETKFAIELGAGRCPAGSWDPVGTLGLLPALGAPTSVYQELTGAGGLASVHPQALRLALARFHSQLEWTHRQVSFFRDSRITVVDPSDHRVRVRFDPSADEPEVWTYDRAALCADHAFRNSFAAATRHHYVYWAYIREATDDAIAMCAALGAAVGRPCQPKPGGPFDASAEPLNDADSKTAEEAAGAVRVELAKP